MDVKPNQKINHASLFFSTVKVNHSGYSTQINFYVMHHKEKLKKTLQTASAIRLDGYIYNISIFDLEDEILIFGTQENELSLDELCNLEFELFKLTKIEPSMFNS